MKQYTQKQLKKYVKTSQAKDLTNSHNYNDIKRPYTQIGYSCGVYGVNGKLLQDNEGNLYAVTKPTPALYMF